MDKRKVCLVPNCGNTSTTHPNKIFLRFPRAKELRIAWLKAIKKNPSNFSVSSNSPIFCCEDHFDLKNDMENWIKFKYAGGPKRIKAHIVPHKFDTLSTLPTYFPTTSEPFRRTIGVKTVPSYRNVEIQATVQTKSISLSPIKFNSVNKKSIKIENIPTKRKLQYEISSSTESTCDSFDVFSPTGNPSSQTSNELKYEKISKSKFHKQTVLRDLLNKFIFCPDWKIILKNLPKAFCLQYKNVQFIIDCLEIEIEKPNDAIKQALTWSEYKKCYTIKYLISCTPDGFINYISEGFAGRTSDIVIIEESGYLDAIPPQACVMANKGFKHVDNLFKERGCTFLRPPMVEIDKKLSKGEVLQTKRIAGLQIDAECVIRRVREYLTPHACIDSHSMSESVTLTDDIVIMACALINLQGAKINLQAP